MAGCGGDVTTATPEGSASAQPTVVVALDTVGNLSAGTSIGGLGVTIELPDAVTVERDANGNVAGSVVTASGVAAGQATVLTLYSPPTSTVPARLYIALASSSSGMNVGEFATITCAVEGIDAPTASDFVLDDFAPVDTFGNAIPALAVGLRSLE